MEKGWRDIERVVVVTVTERRKHDWMLWCPSTKGDLLVGLVTSSDQMQVCQALLLG